MWCAIHTIVDESTDPINAPYSLKAMIHHALRVQPRVNCMSIVVGMRSAQHGIVKRVGWWK
jgi:hypothetical protein